MQYKKRARFASFCMLLAVYSTAQFEDSAFIRYSIKDGLSDNYITTIQQDDRGYIWIGTDNGLNRFDGHSFKKFYQGTAALPLPSNTIWKLISFGNHQLGILSLRGFQVLNTKDFTVQDYFIPDSTAFTTYRNYTLDAALLPDQSFAVATATGFYTFSKKGEIIFRHDKYKAGDIDKRRILYGRKIIPLTTKDYIVYTDEDGIANYNSEKRTLTEVPASDRQWDLFYNPSREKIGYWIDQFRVNASEFIFIQQKQESIVYFNRLLKKIVASPLPFKLSAEINWLSKITQLDETRFAVNSHHRGFFIFHLNKETGKIVFESKRYLPGYRISCLFVDKGKKLWAGTRKGLLYQKQSRPFVKSYRYPVQSPDNPVAGFSDACRYKDKLYLTRYSRYNGLIILDTATMLVQKRISFYGTDNLWNEVYSVAMYHPDTLWLGTNGGLLWFDTKTHRYGKVLDEKKYPSRYFDQSWLNAKDKNGDAWFCYLLNGIAGRYSVSTKSFSFFSPETSPALPFTKVKNVVTDAYGDTWIGGHGLTRWNNKKQLFDTLIKEYGGVNKFNDDILTLSADTKGSLWMHNTDNGLLEYKITDKKFAAYSMKDGLPSAQIRCMSPVVEDILWMGSVNYLTRFNTINKKAMVYDHRDGLPEEFPSSRKIYYDEGRKRFYMFCGDYLAEFPSALPAIPLQNTDILVQELIVNNKRHFFYPKDTISLPFTDNNLSLQFTIVNFDSPENYRFDYKLNNAESWISLAGQRSINLNELQSGHYIVSIKVTDKYGQENTKEFYIIIKPPFWKTNWFMAGLSLLMVAFIGFIYRYRIQQIRQKADLDKQLAETEMKALHSQMNPHFIFNSLNSIREMILNNENSEASRFLSKFAHLIRITLDQSGQAFVSLRNTLDYLRRYIEMEQIRNSHFSCRITTDEELNPDETFLPPMLIQPFIENAIWHGTTAIKKDITINIDFKKENSRVICTIDDNGIGINQSLRHKNNDGRLHEPVGISNIKNRIFLLNEKYNLRYGLTIEDKSSLNGFSETGTLVTLQLPLEIADHE